MVLQWNEFLLYSLPIELLGKSCYYYYIRPVCLLYSRGTYGIYYLGTILAILLLVNHHH